MTELSDRKRSFAAHRFRALGDETRLRLLEFLTSGERTVGDLMEALQLRVAPYQRRHVHEWDGSGHAGMLPDVPSTGSLTGSLWRRRTRDRNASASTSSAKKSTRPRTKDAAQAAQKKKAARSASAEPRRSLTRSPRACPWGSVKQRATNGRSVRSRADAHRDRFARVLPCIRCCSTRAAACAPANGAGDPRAG